jgi:hypothetical protein
MAVAYVSDVEGEITSATTLTLASVVGSGGDMLFIAVNWVGTSSQTISSVTYNGSSTGITQIGTPIDPGTGRALARYRLLAPSGTADVVITFSASVPNAQGTAMVLSGVNQSSPIGTSQTASAVGGSPTTTAAATSAVGDLCVDCLMVQGNATSVATVNGDQTQRSALDGGSILIHRTSTEAGAASVTMGWTWTGAAAWAHAVTPVQAAAAGGAVIPGASSYYRRLRAA